MTIYQVHGVDGVDFWTKSDLGLCTLTSQVARGSISYLVSVSGRDTIMSKYVVGITIDGEEKGEVL